MARMVISILLVGLAGCQSIALSLVGAGAGTALRYGFDGVAYRKIEVEPISARATRVRIAAKNGSLFYDTATAAEIVAQTEQLLGSGATDARSLRTGVTNLTAAEAKSRPFALD